MGHSFPTGFTAERQAWVFIQLRDAKGKVVFASGDLDKNGDLRDDHSHAVLTRKMPYDRHLFNMQNKFIALTYKGTERSVIIPVNRDLLPISLVRPAAGAAASFGRPVVFRIAKSSLPPLGRREQTYSIRVPASSLSPYYFLDVRLNFRHLPPTLLDSLGIANLKSLLEIVTIDGYQVTIPAFAGRR